MSWFSRRKPSVAGGRSRTKEDQAYLEEFVRSRRGVEGFIEPRTTVTETTLLLVAHDGEWTRRRVPSPQDARRFAHRLSMPIYDIALVGYPKRMREYNERRKREAKED